MKIIIGLVSLIAGGELREHAHKAIAPQLKPDHSEFGERFGTAMANSKESHDIDEVLKAAKAGRVESLMVCSGIQQNSLRLVATRISGECHYIY